MYCDVQEKVVTTGMSFGVQEKGQLMACGV